MAGFSVLLILVPVVAASIVVACLPLRSTRRRLLVLGLHVACSSALMIALDGPFALWLLVFGLGFLIASGRLIHTVMTTFARACSTSR